MKKVASIMLWVYGFVANLITYITGIGPSWEALNRYLPTWSSSLIIAINTMLLVFLAFYGIVLLLIYATLPYRKSIGTHKIECKPFNMFVYRFLNRNKKLLKVLHCELYHHCYKLKEDIRRGKISDWNQLQERLTDFLKYAGLALKNSLNLSLAVNLKLLSYSSDNSLFLSPYIQVKQGDDKDATIRERELTYKYILLLDTKIELKRAYFDAKHYNEHDASRLYRVNSIFNYLMNSKQRYWMSNDLAKDEANELFYTSSENYPMHYKSMAVFKIAPPERNILPEGLLIFDTEDKGRFAEKECSQLMGYIAHLLYELFLEYHIYEQNRESKKEQSATIPPKKRRNLRRA